MSGDGFDVDAFLDGYQQRTEAVDLYQRGDLLGEHAQLEAELAEVGVSGASDDDGHVERAQEIATRITEVEAELEASKRTFGFASIPWEDWYRLVAEHPASEEERKGGWKEEVGAEFWVQAVAACSTAPKLTVAQVRKLRTTRAADFDSLRAAVTRLNEGVTGAPKSGLATAVAGLFANSSTNRKAKRSHGRSGAAANGKASRSTSTTKKAS